jgi:hypothetical protein
MRRRGMYRLRKIDLNLQCHKRYPKYCQNQTWP